MLFNTIPFLIFFPLVTAAFYLTPHKWRWLLLLVASCVFYMWFVPKYIFILFATILIDYSAALLIERASDAKIRKRWLTLSICATCLVLFFFKYLGFFHDSVIYLSERLGHPLHWHLANIILPIGLSFHTFQSLSYVIEVYRGRQRAERHLGVYSLYVMFYPQLVTGPIERPQNLLRQLREVKVFSKQNLFSGLELMLFGLFLKMVVADNLAQYVDAVYAHPEHYSSGAIALGMVFYSFQIYCDFFGYSTIALGSAKAMGYDIIDNFRSPYLSTTIGEFWHRWHISLSTWFRDYVYIPLGGSRVRVSRWVLNTMVVFLLSGLWHGAGWTFVLWGAMHGICLVLEGLPSKLRNKQRPSPRHSLLRLLKIALVFTVVTLLWSVFRSSSIEQWWQLMQSLFSNIGVAALPDVSLRVWVLLAVFICLDIRLRNTRFDYWCQSMRGWMQLTVCALLAFCVVAFSSVESIPFIYFQF